MYFPFRRSGDMELRSLPAEEIVAFMGKAAFHWDFDGWMIFASVEM